jgi:DNA-binding response OmpR family regulator
MRPAVEWLRMRVLLVEDHRDLADVVASGLRARGFALDVARDGATGLAKASTVDYDVVVLDRDLPRVHGDEVCRRLRGRTPPWPGKILMLTASGSVDARVDGLRLGADDYLPKPFAFRELVARLEALGRRSGPFRPPVLEHAGLALDPAARSVHRAGLPVELHKKEFGVLEVLMTSPGDVVRTETLLGRVWDEHTDPFTNAVRVTVMRLRRKLGAPDPIETVVGVGYRLR